MTFNESQQRAINHKDGPCLVLAGPGSGKTTVLTQRVKKLVTEWAVPSEQILVITFTKAAADEMRERFHKKMAGEETHVTFGTFHAVFFQILKHAYGFRADNILREEQKRLFLWEIVKGMQLDYEDETEFFRDVLGEISVVKNSMKSVENHRAKCCDSDSFREIFIAYEKKLRLARKIDFDDMLVYTYELLAERKDICAAWQKKFRYILIDEFQDINELQFEIVKLLSKPENHLFAVGDDDQSIYSFRGAAPRLMLDFKKNYPKAEQILLNVNYRCCKSIVERSLTLIEKNSLRYGKEIRAFHQEEGQVDVRCFENPLDEADWVIRRIEQLREQGIDYKKQCVLVRTGSQLGILTAKLTNCGIPFTAKERMPGLFEHWIVEDILAYIRLSKGSYSRKDILRVMNRPNRFFNRQTVDEEWIWPEKWKEKYAGQDWMQERIDKFFADLKIIGTLSSFAAINYIRKGVGYDSFLLEYAGKRNLEPEHLEEILSQLQEHAKKCRDKEKWMIQLEADRKAVRDAVREPRKASEGVVLSTLHGSKGLEYEAVFILDVNETMIPYKKAKLEEELEEERRMFYVGMTRAEKILHLCHVKQYHNHLMEPSRFLTEMQER